MRTRSGLFQYAVAEALALPESHFTAFRGDRRAKRDLLAAGLTEAGSRFSARPAPTSSPPTSAPLGETGGFAFCRALPESAGVVTIPNAVFYDHREMGTTFVRFAFCKRDDVLHEAASRLQLLTS